MHIPRYQSSIPENMHPFADVRKRHYDMITYELELRGATFERTKMIPKVNTTKFGVNQLIYILRANVYPNEEDESKIVSKEDKAKDKYFLPNYLTSKKRQEKKCTNYFCTF